MINTDFFGRGSIPPHNTLSSPFIDVIALRQNISRLGFADFRFYAGLTQRDVEAYVATNWKEVSPPMLDGSKSNIRKEAPSKRRDRIMEAAFLNDKALGYVPGQKGTRYERIASYLHRRYQIKISAENAQKIIRRTLNIKR